MSEREPAPDHFVRVVKNWEQLGPPLRPSPEDTAVVQLAAHGLNEGAHVAVLGLTPEIVACVWPPRTELCAIDHSAEMIAAMWRPEHAPPGARAIIADWRELPLDAESLDLVAGDGCFTMFPPDEATRFAREISRVVRPGGRFVVRQFVRLTSPESLETIADAMRAGAIGSVHALKLRLHAALHGRHGEGTLLADIYPAWKSMPPLPEPLRGSRGWTAAEIEGVESYAERPGRFHLPTLKELRALVAPFFHEIECCTGTYELAERCPTLVLERKKATGVTVSSAAFTGASQSRTLGAAH